MRKLLILTCLFFVYLRSGGQTPVGTWTDHLVYSTARNIAVGSEEVYASTGSSLIVYNRDFDELRKMSRVNGLTETAISTIAWSEENKALIIAYSSANLDIIKDNVIYNIPDISRKYIPGKKEINRIRISGKYAYLVCSFGIIVIDIPKHEIYDTWKPGNGTDNPEIWDMAFGNGYVYAATGSGVYSANIDNPGLSYFGNWSIINSLPTPNGKYTAAVFSGNKLYVNMTGKNFPGDYIYALETGAALFSYTPGIFNVSFDKAADGFTVASGKSVRYFHNDGSLQASISSYSWGTPNASQAIEDQGDIWIADIASGLVKGKNMSDFTAFTLPGPISNDAVSVTSYNGKTIVCGGGVDNAWNNLSRPFQISVHENNTWTNIRYTDFSDAMRAYIDPADETHFFVTSWGGGLLEYRNDELMNRYKDNNSPLHTIVPGAPYVRLCGIAMDKNRNLWITGSEVPGTLKALKPDGTWIVNPATADVLSIGDLIITRTGKKWVVLPRGNGLFVMDDNDTPDYFDDDLYKQMYVTDPDGKVITSVYCLAEDLEGNIWVGTDQGPLIYYNPDKVFEEEIKAYPIKIPRNDGSGLADLVLFTESISSIAIDGANRKWLGTESSGAYLLSPDGTRKLKNYNEQNSPILSNSVASVAVDNKKGDVWFVTSQGVISVRGDATEGKEAFSGVYSFPNPVREDFEGNVTVTGLMKDTQIRITDISGNLVYETVSDGGQASWDLKTYNGRRVATGVYLVFCASSNGSQTAMTKILVIN
jgi:TSS9, PorZ, N-terminal beta-propeller domain